MADHKVARDKGSQFYFKKVGTVPIWGSVIHVEFVL